MRPIATHWTLALCPLVLVLLSGCMTAPEEKLRLAAAEGNLLRVQTFLGQGISAQAADGRGMTPLFWAAKNGHPDVVALLLERGAAMNPLRQDGVTPIFIAAQEGQRKVVALLLRHGGDANAHARIGDVTLLHVAAYRGDQELITLLLQHGANKHARMTSGERPVDLAQTQGHLALIPLLEP
jgi:ankyrin repeat protein